MNYAKINTCDIANGSGVRVSLFVSGCRRHCKGCFNQEAQDFNYGKPFTKEEEDYILTYLRSDYCSGLTILGGEPLEPENQQGLLPFLRRVKREIPMKSIWCYTGYTYKDGTLAEAAARTEITPLLFECIDVLIDGPFEEEQKDISLRFRGSSNQRIIDLQRSLKEDKVIIYMN